MPLPDHATPVSNAPAELSQARPAAAGPCATFLRTHLFDYTAPARTLWFAIVGAGLAAAAFALLRLAHEPAHQAGLALLAAVAAAVASFYPVRIPRSTFCLSTAEVCTFLALALLGPPAAVLAAGVDGLVGAWRGSRRLSSRLATPAAGMMAAAGAGALFEAVLAPLAGVLSEPAALMASLGLAAAVVYVGQTLPLTSMMSLKRGASVSLRDWFGNTAWVGATMQITALLSALVVLNARLFGLGLIAAAGALVAASVVMLRVSLTRQEAERAAQDEKLELARREAEINQQRFTAAFSHAAVGMAIVGTGQRTLQVNRALAQLLGHAEGELIGRDFQRFLHPSDVPLLARLMRDLADRPDETFTVQLRCQHRDGEELWVALHCSRFDDPGAVSRTEGQCLIYQVHDITSRHLAEQRLQHIAFHDSLTDLANRACFTERLALAVERSCTEPAERFAVLFLDLDRFKVVNDSLGHQAGNELLCQVAARLRAGVRPRDLVARLGGDEFAILFDGLDDAEHAHQLATRLGESLARPLSIQGTEVVPGASIGITFSDLGYRTVDEILRDADLAMYEAKAAGRGRVAVFDTSMHERIADRLALEADLRHAIGAGKLSAAFQPIFALQGTRLVGFEALARWKHPTRGHVSPAVFITLAEEAGHIEAVTRWMIDHAAGELARWRREMPEHSQLHMNINISGRDLASPDFVSHVEATLRKYDLPASLLTLEITETTLMNRLETALVALHALRAIGVRFSIDDFGTGYSSLAYLSSLPIDSLKIDRSFVIGTDSGAQNVEIVRAVLELGHTLGKVVVAEGIETAAQLQLMQRLGVDCGQGYLLSRPLSGDALREVLLTHAPVAA